MYPLDKRDYVSVPVEMCYDVVRHKRFSQFQLFLLLKHRTSGICRLYKSTIGLMASELNVTPRTISNNVARLLQMNWIGYNPTTQNYFVRGFEAIRQIEGMKSRSGAEFNLRDIHHTKAFAISTVIGNLINCQKRAERRGGASNIGYAIQPPFQSVKYYPISNTSLHKILNISMSSASVFKRIASDSTYIDRRRNYKVICNNKQALRYLRKANPEVAHLFTLRGHNVVIVQPDTMLCSIHFTRRKKIDTYNIGIVREITNP